MYLKLTVLLAVFACCVVADGHKYGLTVEYDKKGECPAPSDMEPATDNECYTDNDCEGENNCCSDAFGKYQCIKPRPRERQGKCPVEEIGICVFFEPCTSDNECEKNEKCCRNACGGRSCKKVEPEKDEKTVFLCPALNSCSSNGNCKGNKMCCPNDCGFKTCKKTELLSKGIKACPAQSVTLPLHDQCKTDDDCPGRRQKCCPNQCGVNICKMAKEIDCSRVRCADPVCGFGEVAYTPKNSCCKTCKRDCSKVFCLNPVCKPDEVRFVPEGGCCYRCKQDCSRILCDIPICEEGEKLRVLEGKCCPTCVKDESACIALPDTICGGIGGLRCPQGYVCDLSDVPPGTVDGAGICCEATCVDEDTGESYKDGETFQKDCNTCKCLKNGGIVCTRKLCRPCVQADGVSYPPGSTYKVQCNTCGCSDGLERCTLIACEGCLSGLPAGKSCNLTDPNSCPTKGFECEPSGKDGVCCKQPTCDRPLNTTYCNKNGLICPSNYYCLLDGGKEELGFCCLDCRTVRCGEVDCKPGYVAHQSQTECCKTCKKVCDGILCPDLKCVNTFIPKDECCPKCRPPDCSATLCLRPTCKFGEELFVPKDECCSLCKKPNDCYDKKRGVIYKEGERFRFRCNGCQCEKGDISCTDLDCEEGYCESGLKPNPTAICSEHKECSVKGYKCEKSSQCCREPNCRNALAHTFCSLNLRCPLGYKCNFLEEEANGFCCKAKPCFNNGVWYESGESFKDQCNDCFCSDGVAACTKKGCRPCIQANGVSYPSGSTYRVQCNTCECSDGIESCTLIACEGCQSGLPAGKSCNLTDPNSCPTKGFECEPSEKDGVCCRQPTCIRALKRTFCSKDGLTCPSKYYCKLDGGKEGFGFCCLDCRTVLCAEPLCKPGYVVHQPETQCCKTCIKDCSATTCLHPTCKCGEELFSPEDECCSVCKKPNDCYDKTRGVIYKEGERFRFRCNSCQCEKGGISCTELDCEEGYCESGLKPHPKDVCSPNKKCSLKGYKCEKSSLCCREPNCPNALAHTFCALNLRCPLGYRCNFLEEEANGFCCKAKPCFKYGVRYESGESFKDQCNDCFCSDGVAACTKKGCPRPCFRYGVRYESGQSFKDLCNECVCTDGVAVCTNNPCSDCHFRGVIYKEGAAVNIEEECGECICMRTGFKNAPKFEVKCPKCCVKDNQVFQTGKGFKGLSVCEECSCEEGKQYANIICALRSCPNCDGHPEEGECCPVCSHEPEP